MIGKLRGFVDSVAEESAIIDVGSEAGGVGYLVFASRRTLGHLVAGEAASLLIETHVREDHIHLFGFIDAGERDWFRLLLTVQGVGTRHALAILSVLDPASIAQAIAAQDKAAVTRANGVGPKLAQRITAELKDKAGAIALGAAARAAPAATGTGRGGAEASAGGLGGPAQDAVSALVNLGYRPTEAFGAVAAAERELGPDAAVEALVRGGLRELSS